MNENLVVNNERLMNEWNWKKNKEFNPNVLTYGSNKKVWWKCSQGHEWEAKINNRYHGRGCPICSGKQVLIGYNDLNTTNPELTPEWHPTKNKNLQPTNIVRGSNKNVWWKCKNGHEWQTSVYNRAIQRRSCPFCSGYKAIEGMNDLLTISPEIAKEWHPTKNGKLLPSQITKGSGKRVWWKCKNGHEWCTTIYHRMNGNNCPVCNGKKVCTGYNDLATTNPEIAKEWHPNKNGKLLPTQVKAGSARKIWWMCIKGHEWYTSLNSRKSGSDCPICSSETHTSFPEQAIFYYLNKIYQVENRYIIDNMEIDIYIPIEKIGIEYDGKYFHKGNASLQRENRKNQILKNKNIYLIRIKEIEKGEINIKNDNVIYYQPTNNYENLEEAIKKLLKLISKIVNKRITVDININRDISKIYEQYINNEKKNSLLEYNDLLAKEWHPDKNGKLRPEYVSKASTKLVWWQCANGHEWQATPHHRSKGRGCPVCSGHKIVYGINDLTTTNPELISEWHPTKNNDLRPTEVGKGSNRKVWWKCKSGHEWQTKICHRTNGSNCPFCAKSISYVKKKVIQFDLNENFIKEYDSIQAAIDATGASKISEVCRGVRKTSGGYIWKYK